MTYMQSELPTEPPHSEAASPAARQKRPRPKSYKGQPAWKRNCKCGACPTCQDNARWERGFAKFEDPDYYTRGLHLRHSSSLAHE
jgi:hypothetical protein